MANLRVEHLAASAETRIADGGLALPGTRVGTRRLENRVLAGLPQDDLARLARHIDVVSLPASAALQDQNVGIDHLYFPHYGVISLLAMTDNGETIELASAGRGGAMCRIHASAPGDGLLLAIAPGPLRASRIHASRVSAALAESAALARALTACREALLLQLRQNLVCCGLHPVEHRLARWLLETAERSESELIPATQEQVAQRLGVRRTTVTLLASKLQDVGAIRWGRAKVQVLDRARLETMACGCHTALRERERGLLPAAAIAGKDLAG
jgi:CRP-like cAMP-binding protein